MVLNFSKVMLDDYYPLHNSGGFSSGMIPIYFIHDLAC